MTCEQLESDPQNWMLLDMIRKLVGTKPRVRKTSRNARISIPFYLWRFEAPLSRRVNCVTSHLWVVNTRALRKLFQPGVLPRDLSDTLGL